MLNVGKIDDADETYFNGVKVGGLGHFPPQYVTAWTSIGVTKCPRTHPLRGEEQHCRPSV